ncbi:OLC1v1000729C1 [Oldenlandia corymbosa var. corymbosa]|uniref:Translation initiation factor eIF2B subunit epsilon n=1 Tax=Oldenlandia corymbosa var. corymbosa TaxID=529605 RepID=A0AAV1D3M7_OLDCO|nr:OLC1v1000729C1 [Oldenlandia corymbosa var. corymbosa]
MVAKKGGATRGGGGAATMSEDSVEELTRVPLQAILLADSFATKFRPITLERPKVLLPLVNVPMIDYTLSWLESAGVEEVFVFCCAHAKQVIEHLDSSQWFKQPNFTVTTIESNNSAGAGDALRLIYEQNVIRGDFVLVSGDTISNMPLSEALKEHRERRKKDNNAIMTMVVRQSKPSPVTRQSRLGTDELFMAIDPETKQLLYYEERADNGTVSIDKTVISDHPSMYIHNDKQDCYIDICAPEVLSTFADNFDYQHLRRHFLKGLLDDDIMGYKIFTHEIHASYAARIDNFRSYDTVSKDIIQRWTYPLVPDVQLFGNTATKLERRGMYRGSGVGLSRSAQIGPFTVVGSGTTVGTHSEISNSVVGKSCKIGENVSIDGSYIWHDVTIEDGCVIKNALVCDGVIIKSGVILEPGVVLSYKVVVGQNFVVPAYSKVSLYQQPIKQDSDEELEYADNSSGTMDISSLSSLSDKLNETTSRLSELQLQSASEVGNGGVGLIWSTSEGSHEEEWRHSVAPIPADKLEILYTSNDELEVLHQDGNVPPPEEMERDSVASDSSEDIKDEFQTFEKEVFATFERAVLENHKDDNVILEVNSLRLSFNLDASDCAGPLFYSIMKWALTMGHSSPSELVKNVASLLTKWQKVLKYYMPSIDEEIEVIMKFEEMCMESAKEYSQLFLQILHLLYDKDIVQEEAILNWASEKENADESDKVLLKQAESLIQWLKEASEEEDEDED